MIVKIDLKMFTGCFLVGFGGNEDSSFIDLHLFGSFGLALSFGVSSIQEIFTSSSAYNRFGSNHIWRSQASLDKCQTNQYLYWPFVSHTFSTASRLVFRLCEPVPHFARSNPARRARSPTTCPPLWCDASG